MVQRIIWKITTGDEPPTVDHRNLAKSVNEFANLRPATHAQNCQNRRGKKKRRAGTLKGAYWNRREKVWRAFIMANGVSEYLGRFATEEEAHAKYCERAAVLHGEFANLESAPAQ